MGPEEAPERASAGGEEGPALEGCRAGTRTLDRPPMPPASVSWPEARVQSAERLVQIATKVMVTSRTCALLFMGAL